jgi:endonuclease V-like protein UPF0215 family
VKSGTRTLGVAVSGGQTATIAGAVVRVDRVVDGFAYATCEVGGRDATAAVESLLAELAREDIQYLLTAGVAPAWFNLLDLPRLAETFDGPVVAVSFEQSPGLEPALREQFDGEALADRLAVYERQPPRERVAVGDETVWVQAAGCNVTTARELVQATTPDGSGRPEPLRVARLAARARRRDRESA